MYWYESLGTIFFSVLIFVTLLNLIWLQKQPNCLIFGFCKRGC